VIKGFVSAMRTLTVFRVPGEDTREWSTALPWFPVVGLLLGFTLYGLSGLFERVTQGEWPEGTGVLLVISGTILTRGLHLDGLSDWADGFWGARRRDRILTIMKDSHLGVFGGLALLCVLLTKWVCFSRLVETGSQNWIIAAYIVSRTMQVDLAAAHPYARPEGGKGEPFIAGARPRHLALTMIIAVILLLSACGLHPKWPVIMAAEWIIARSFGTWCRARIGGITGDLLGAGSEIVETTVLLAGAVIT